MLNSTTLLDAITNVQRYFRVVGEGEDIEVERMGPHVTLRFRETDQALRGLRHNSDYIAAIIVRGLPGHDSQASIAGARRVHAWAP